MEMNPECVPCLIRRVLFETMEVDPSKARETVEAATRMLAELFVEGACSAVVATKVHRRVYDILGDDDPYAELKRKSNQISLELYPAAQEHVDSSDDRLRAAFLCAVMGNVLDFGIGSGFDHPARLREEFGNLLAEGLGHDDTGEIEELLKGAEKVVYLVDNCGEVVLDRLVLRELRSMGLHVTLVVKGEPILTDVTKADMEGLGIEELDDEVVETPGFAIGLDIDSLDGPLGDLLRGADLVIAKGMANYELLSETDISPIAYLLRTKCRPVADSMGLAKDINVVQLVRKE
ncbi:MAG: ARMT1-like domain-containing protein [Thermoplasmata archaeon]|nr:ARMT1-like domain-containing protein [Thermoplasmata archaeon]